ncbi:hypothetical protein N7450_006946 [Penicillium hetheringtonii]|uniref:Uncharacterized protein n=1 Tax=Penicillium hetheringtonii TaxID=911720 RepID=A0AAD6GS56_9EURO|nr:hypothetical protein N7450_006946 [Penicillium hetheringtonii]
MSATLTSTTSTEQPLPLTTVFSPPRKELPTGAIWVLPIHGDVSHRAGLPTRISHLETHVLAGGNQMGMRKSSWTFTPRGSATVDRPWHSFEICDYGINSTVTYTALNTNENGLSTETTTRLQTPGQSWNAYGIELRWRATDPRPVPATSTTSGMRHKQRRHRKEKVPQGSRQVRRRGLELELELEAC